MLTDQDKSEFKQTIQSNKHEIFIVSFDEMEAIIQSFPNCSKPGVKEAWKKIKGNVGFGASYYSSTDGAVTLAKLVGDLGSLGAKANVKSYDGKPHLILKGYPGLRNILTGTKYGIDHPTVLKMGPGKAGAIKGAKTGGILTIVLLSTFRVVDYFLTDETTLSQLVGTLSTDVVKVGITTGASIMTAAMVSAISGVATFAIGPLVAVVVVGVGLSLLLDSADKRYGITDNVIAGIDEVGDSIEDYIEYKKAQVQKVATNAAASAIDYAIESARGIVICRVNDRLKQFVTPKVY